MPVRFNDTSYLSIKWLEQALSSALSSDILSELIIIDDASAVSIASLLRDLSVDSSRISMLVNTKPMGIVRSLNRALSFTNCEYVTRLDCDDSWSPSKLDIQRLSFQSSPDLALVYGGMNLVDESGRILETIDRDYDHDGTIKCAATKYCPVPHGSIMVRTDALRAIGGYVYSPHSIHAEDYATWQTLMRFFLVTGYSDIFLNYRIHAGSVSSRNSSVQAANSRHIMAAYANLPTASMLRLLVNAISAQYGLDFFNASVFLATAWKECWQISIPDNVLSVAKKVFYDRILVPLEKDRYVLYPA